MRTDQEEKKNKESSSEEETEEETAVNNPNRIFELVFIISQIILIIIYGFCTTYGEGVHPAVVRPGTEEFTAKDEVQTYYPLYQDVHVMIFIGFGFLMVFLKTHSWTSVGFNMLIACYAVELTIIVQAFWHQFLVEREFYKVEVSVVSLILGDFGAGAVLITFGAILGKCSIF